MSTVWRSYHEQWPIGTAGKIESRECVVSACPNDDDWRVIFLTLSPKICLRTDCVANLRKFFFPVLSFFAREGVAPSPTPWYSSYRKRSLRVTRLRSPTLFTLSFKFSVPFSFFLFDFFSSHNLNVINTNRTKMISVQVFETKWDNHSWTFFF